jgi:hypothetical protein
MREGPSGLAPRVDAAAASRCSRTVAPAETEARDVSELEVDDDPA